MFKRTFDARSLPIGALRRLLRREGSSDAFTLETPAGTVEVQRDANGYPTIRARNRFDAAWAKGWIHARDRLGQVRLSAMASRGRMMELLGDSPMTRTVDRAVRLLRFSEGLSDHVAAMKPETRRFVELYCEGFEAGRRGRPWSKVLELLGVDVGPHTPEDVLSSYRLICFFGLTSYQQIAEMLVAELVQNGADEDFLHTLLGHAAEGIDVDAIRAMRIPHELALLTPLGGSNAFAVAGDRSSSGGAMVMSEAHMEIGRLPPIFYVTHEEFTEEECGFCQGVSIPGVPWLTMGRTRYVGWTYTFGHADNVDVLIEECENGRYRAGDEWRPLRRRTERAKIRGGEDELWTFWDNEYGSIGAERADGFLPCVRWTGLHESTAGDVDAIVEGLDCRTLEDIAEVHRRLDTISLGAVIADSTGRIGLVHTGRVDERPDDWTGGYPRPGGDLTERTPQPLDESARPWTLDPDEGFIVSANENVEGAGGESWTTYPEPPYRWERLREILADVEEATLRDLVTASYDETDRMARRLMPVWGPLLPDDAGPLRRWANEHGARQSADEREQMGLFHALHHEVVRELLERTLTSDDAVRVLDDLGLLLCFQYHLDQALALERTALLDEGDLRDLLQTAWPRAKRLVADGWDVPVRAGFESIFTQGKLPVQLGFSTPERDLPGGPTSPFQTRVVAFEGEKMVGGPAYHYVFDMTEAGGWYHIPGGASELPWGAGYATGVDEWHHGVFHPLGSPDGDPPDLD